jgi:hypothetical protein
VGEALLSPSCIERGAIAAARPSYNEPMAGYSGTPLPQKLGLKPGGRFGLVGAPADFARTLGALPPGVLAAPVSPGKSPFDVIVCFAASMAEVARLLPVLKRRLDPAGGLWMAWPKKTRKKTQKPAALPASDVNENEVRAAGLAAGLVDNKVCAIDDVWSGLRFVFRLVDRPKSGKR